MVTRINLRKIARKFLQIIQALFGPKGKERLRYQLFDSSAFGENDLLFKDVTDKLAILTEDEDISQVLGLDYVALLKGLGHEGAYSHWELSGGQRDPLVLYQSSRAEEM